MLMLKKEEGAQVERPAEVQTLIGKGCSFEGKLTFEGTVRIDGHFNGQIVTRDTLLVSASATVQAEVTAGTVIVHGTLEGNVTASAVVELHPPARMRGNLHTPALSIAKGVVFEGACRMEGGGEKPVLLPDRTPPRAAG